MQNSVNLLQRSLARKRLAHAYLFTGNQLEELGAVARALAQTINCPVPVRKSEDGTSLDACGECHSCRQIASGNHADIVWVRPESKMRIITIEQIRNLMHTIHMKPNSARWKVGIIAAADRLTVQSANAFLKTLEEPPPQSILMLLTTEPDRILDTLHSRCLHLNLAGNTAGYLSAAEEAWLADFAGRVAVEPPGLLGRYRLLDAILRELGQQKSTIEKQCRGRFSMDSYEEVEPKVLEHWERELNAMVEAEYRQRRGRLLVTLQWWLRDIWLCAGGHEVTMLLPALEEGSRAVGRRLTPGEAARNLEIIQETIRLLETNVQETLTFEVGILKLAL